MHLFAAGRRAVPRTRIKTIRTMAQRGLQEAIRAVGGVTELARRIGISQPSVSNWTKIPAERVLAVEAVSGVPRATLRPDLYGESSMDEVDLARASEYALLANVLTRAPDAKLLAQLAELRGDATPLGVAHVELAEAAKNADVARIEREFFDLFIGIGRGELLPYASYYLTGFLHERPLARLRADLAGMGVERAEDMYEPEDHIGILFEVMGGLASKRLPAPEGSDRKIFEKHLKPWAARFFSDLEHTKSAKFYRAVGRLGRVFIDIEAEAFALPS